MLPVRAAVTKSCFLPAFLKATFLRAVSHYERCLPTHYMVCLHLCLLQA